VRGESISVRVDVIRRNSGQLVSDRRARSETGYHYRTPVASAGYEENVVASLSPPQISLA
jgi:hypothetical protein